MTAVGASTASIAFDFLLALGFSLGVWFCYQVFFAVLSPRGVVAATLLHMLFFAVAGLAAFCFVIGKTTSQEPRWHMALGFALGAWVYYGIAARYVRAVTDGIKKLLALAARPVVRLAVWLGRCVSGAARSALRYLQKRRQMLYNRRKEKQRARRARRGNHGRDPEPEKEKKKPLQAYTQS